MVPLSPEEERQLTYAAILRQLAEGVIVTDAVGTITFVNNAAAEIHGVARLDVKPNAYSETYHLYREDGRHYPSDELPLARAVRGETVKDARWRIRRPDGREVLAVGTAQPLRALDGRRIGAVLTLRDATAQDVAERSLERRETALSDARKQLGEHATDSAADEGARKINAPEPRTAIGGLEAPLREIAASARRMQSSTSLEDARSSAEHIRATASALLALIGERPPKAPSSDQPTAVTSGRRSKTAGAIGSGRG